MAKLGDEVRPDPRHGPRLRRRRSRGVDGLGQPLGPVAVRRKGRSIREPAAGARPVMDCHSHALRRSATRSSQVPGSDLPRGGHPPDRRRRRRCWSAAWPAVRELGLASFDDYYRLVVRPAARRARTAARRISTNETQFFREPRHFEFLNEHAFPRHGGRSRAAGSRRVRAWSAACSTGEEPYSLAMALLRRFPPAGWQVEVVATDLSTQVLRAAQAGALADEKADDIPLALSQGVHAARHRRQAGKMKAGPEIRGRGLVRAAEPQRRRSTRHGAVRPHVLPQRAHLLRRESKTQACVDAPARVISRRAAICFSATPRRPPTLTDRLRSVGPNVYTRAGCDRRARGRQR